jgi:putative oxidoreductase
MTELVAGSMLVLGLLTPLAAGACMGVMLVAAITNHMRNGFFIFRPGEGWEYVANLAFASLAIGCLGAGRWSLDNAINYTPHGWRGLIGVLVIGVGGSAALLVTFWRPPAREPKA